MPCWASDGSDVNNNAGVPEKKQYRQPYNINYDKQDESDCLQAQSHPKLSSFNNTQTDNLIQTAHCAELFCPGLCAPLRVYHNDG